MQNYTIDETSKIIRVGRTRLYEEINNGRLKAFKVGKRTLISDASIQDWLANLPFYPTKYQGGNGNV